MFKKWLIIYDAGIFVDISYNHRKNAVVGITEVFCNKPIGDLCNLGSHITDFDYMMEVQWLNYLDRKSQPDSIGTFGFIDFRPYLISHGYAHHRPQPSYQWYANPTTEAIYGTHIAFDTLPLLPFTPRYSFVDYRNT
jgi:hypothetical protein